MIGNNSTAPSTSNTKKIDATIQKSPNTVLKGVVGSTWNGGIMHVLSYKKVYAGTNIKSYNIQGQIRMLTPLVPLGTKLTTTVKAFFVPNSRVWDDAEDFAAQKASNSSSPYTEEPYIRIADMVQTVSTYSPMTDTTAWRDSIISCYYPRIMSHRPFIELDPINNIFVSAMPLRGYTAIYNDFIRNKNLDPEIPENKTRLITDMEKKGWIPTGRQGEDDQLQMRNMALKCRGKKRNNYYTNWRTKNIGDTTTKYSNYTNQSTQSLMYHTEWQKTIAELRQSAENAEMNDWEIIAKIRGSMPAYEGKVQLIGEKEIGHNYAQVAQTVYNESTPNEEFQSLGTTGAYSYTEFNIDIINNEIIIEDGYIHIIAQTSADTIFSGGINRELTNVSWDSQYRPELAELKDDTFNRYEINTQGISRLTDTIGFKRKYSECFILPSHITGDYTSGGFTDLETNTIIPSESFWLCQENQQEITSWDDRTLQPHYWKDNTDMLINETMTLKQQYKYAEATAGYGGNNVYTIMGKNQFKCLAETTMIADLPFDSSIKDDFKEQGEV